VNDGVSPSPKGEERSRLGPLLHRRTRDCTMEGVHVVGGRARESGGWKYPSGVQGQSPGRVSAPPMQKLKQNVKLAYTF